MLLFCPLCGGLLLINNQPVSSSPASSSNSFSCKSCAYIFPIESKNYSARVELTRKKVDDVLGGEDAWKNVDSTDATCPKCENNRAYFMQIQIRSADEPSSIFYKCCRNTCGHQWREVCFTKNPIMTSNEFDKFESARAFNFMIEYKNLWKTFNSELDGIYLLPSFKDYNKFYGVCFDRSHPGKVIEFSFNVKAALISVDFTDNRNNFEMESNSSLLTVLLAISKKIKMGASTESNESHESNNQIFAELLAEF